MSIPDFTPTVPTINDDTPDFTPSSNVKFKLYGETYYGVAELTLEDSFTYDSLSRSLSDADRSIQERIDVMREILKTLLDPESAAKLIERLSDRVKPVGLATTTKIFRYIMENHGGRPTQPGTDSSNGSVNPESGTSSTEDSSAEVSTH